MGVELTQYAQVISLIQLDQVWLQKGMYLYADCINQFDNQQYHSIRIIYIPEQRCWLFPKNMAHNGALKMFISCTESSHQIARTPVRQTPPV